MTPENVTPENAAAETQSTGMSEISRMTGVFFEPGKTFEDIGRRPHFVAPLVLMMVASLVYTVLYSQHVGWERLVRRQIEASPQMAQLTSEQREQRIQAGAKFAPVVGYVIPVLVPLGYLISAAVLLAMVKMMAASMHFKQVFAVICYSAMPGIIFIALAIVVMFLKNPDDFDLRNPLAFNLGALIDPATGSKFLYSLGTSLDVFAIWRIILVALGLKAAGGKSLSLTGAFLAVLIPWGVWVLGSAALAR